MIKDNNITRKEPKSKTVFSNLPNYESIVDELIENQPNIISVAIIENDSEIVFSTRNWDLTKEIGQINSIWGKENEYTLIFGGQNYRIFQNTPDRLAASLKNGEYNLIGFKDEEREIICKVLVKKEDALIILMTTFMELGRALGQLSSRKPFIKSDELFIKADQIDEIMPKFLFDTSKILQRLGLQKFGLGPEEAKVYLALLKRGAEGDKISNLNKELYIKRPTLYKIMDRLMDRNWVDMELRTNKRTQFYIARPIVEVVDRIIREKIEEIKILKSFQLLIDEYLGKGFDEVSKFYDESQSFSRDVFDIDVLGIMGVEKDFGILVFEYEEDVVDEIRAQDKLSLIYDKIIEQLEKLKEEEMIQDIGNLNDSVKLEHVEIQDNQGANIYIRFKRGSETARQLGEGWIIAIKAVVIPIENLIYVIWGSEEKFKTLLDIVSNLK